jgi:hypothetical protein
MAGKRDFPSSCGEGLLRRDPRTAPKVVLLRAPTLTPCRQDVLARVVIMSLCTRRRTQSRSARWKSGDTGSSVRTKESKILVQTRTRLHFPKLFSTHGKKQCQPKKRRRRRRCCPNYEWRNKNYIRANNPVVSFCNCRRDRWRSRSTGPSPKPASSDVGKSSKQQQLGRRLQWRQSPKNYNNNNSQTTTTNLLEAVTFRDDDRIIMMSSTCILVPVSGICLFDKIAAAGTLLDFPSCSLISPT